jgi:sarcosine reductase
MALELGNIQIEDVAFGQETRLDGTTLLIEQEALRDFLIRQDDRIKALHIAIAKPGQSTRILCVKDVIEPWCKVHGDHPGEGRNHVLKNVAVVTCGKIVGYQEGIIDMSGPGAAHSPFSKTFNVVLELGVASDLAPHQHEEVVRHAGLQAASFLGEAARDATPNELETYEAIDASSVSSDLPRVAYVYMLLSQGLLHDTYVFGRDAKEGLPRTIPPHVLMDGAVTSGNCVSACDKNTTYHHQNNPVLRELYQRHRKELNFVGRKSSRARQDPRRRCRDHH